MVRIHPDPPIGKPNEVGSAGGVAQLGERMLCKHEVIGSIPFTSTSQGLCLKPKAGGWEKSRAKEVRKAGLFGSGF